MILHLSSDISQADQDAVLAAHPGFHFVDTDGTHVIVTSSKEKEAHASVTHLIKDSFVFENDIQLASRSYQSETRTIQVKDLQLGGSTGHTAMIAGPCSVEDRAQLMQTAEYLSGIGVKILRGGCYKPRTSPYSFQGLGLEGLKLLAEARDKFGMAIITEVRDATHVAEVIEYSDIIQIGAKAMYDQGILKACAKIKKPVMIKRGFGTTLQEFVQAAEFVLSGGNPNVILCERGIRTFETKTRFTYDLCGVAWLKQYTNLPLILDPSHAMGYRFGIPDLCRASVALGVDGLIIETHPTPPEALSDAAQQLDFAEFKAMHESLPAVAQAVGRKMI